MARLIFGEHCNVKDSSAICRYKRGQSFWNLSWLKTMNIYLFCTSWNLPFTYESATFRSVLFQLPSYQWSCYLLLNYPFFYQSGCGGCCGGKTGGGAETRSDWIVAEAEAIPAQVTRASTAFTAATQATQTHVLATLTPVADKPVFQHHPFFVFPFISYPMNFFSREKKIFLQDHFLHISAHESSK